MGLFDLRQQLSFYGAYHSDARNVLVHTIFVPTLVFTALIFLCALPSLYEVDVEIPNLIDTTLVFNWAFVYVCVTGIYYVLLEPCAGFTFFMGMLMMWFCAVEWVVSFGARAYPMAIGIHIFSWIMQFIGHGVFEGRKPALLDSLLQSIVLAPLFVWLHILFFVGYRKGLQHDIEAIVEQNIKEWKNEAKTKSS